MRKKDLVREIEDLRNRVSMAETYIEMVHRDLYNIVLAFRAAGIDAPVIGQPLGR